VTLAKITGVSFRLLDACIASTHATQSPRPAGATTASLSTAPMAATTAPVDFTVGTACTTARSSGGSCSSAVPPRSADPGVATSTLGTVPAVSSGPGSAAVDPPPSGTATLPSARQLHARLAHLVPVLADEYAGRLGPASTLIDVDVGCVRLVLHQDSYEVALDLITRIAEYLGRLVGEDGWGWGDVSRPCQPGPKGD